MYTFTSEAFNENILSDSRHFIARISKTDKNSVILKELPIDIKTIQFHGSGVSEDTITLGSTVSAYIEVEAGETDELLENEEIKLEIGLSYKETEEFVPVGYFTVEKPNTCNGITKFTAYDRMLKFNKSVDINFPTREDYTADSVLEMIGNAVGVKIVTPEELKGKKYGLIYRWRETYTYREAISYFASYYGYFAIINRNGELEFRWYKDNDYIVNTDRYFSFEKSDIAFKVGRLDCTTGTSEDKTWIISSGAGVKGISFYNPIMYQKRLDTLFNELGGMIYQPSCVNMIGDIRLDVGDVITVTDEKGLIYSVPIMKLSFSYDGGLAATIETVGESDAEVEAEFAGPTETKIERITTKINGIDLLIAEKADITQLNAVTAEIGNLTAKAITTENLTSSIAKINTLTSEDAVIKNIRTQVLNTDTIKAAVADVGYITADSADIRYITSEKADLKYLTSQSADLKYANINMANVTTATMAKVFADTGLITSATIKDGHVTGYLDSVEVNANMITAGTLTVDRLVIRGSEKSIIYELNNITGALQSKNTNTLNGEVLTKRTINCDRIVAGTITANEIAAGTITADKINVNNISAAVAKVINIDAAKITSGTISADRIDINNLFARHINSTGGISTTGTYAGNITFKNTISGGKFTTYIAEEELGCITPIKISDTKRYFSILANKASAFSIGTSENNRAYYFMNNGGNPNGITYRHQFVESVYIDGSLNVNGGYMKVGSKVEFATNNEGGNIAWFAPDGTKWEFDCYNNNFRLFNYSTYKNFIIDKSGNASFPANLSVIGTLNVTGGAVKTSGSSGVWAGAKIKMWSDNEGGNLEITSSTGNTCWQVDALNDVLRIYQHNNSTGANYFPLNINGYTTAIGRLTVSDTINGYNIGGSVSQNNNGLITGGNVYNALGSVQIVEILGTGLLSTGAAISNGTTATLSTSFSMWPGATNQIVIPTTFRYCDIESISVSGGKLNITVRNTSGASHTLSASFQIVYYKYK